MILICSKCGEEIERTYKVKFPVCFDCRTKRNKETAAKRKRALKEGSLMVKKNKLIVSMVENPHEKFVKYTKKLIYSFPARHNKKTIEYDSWLTRDYFERQHCCKCETKLVFLCREDNPYNISSCCPNKNCCLHTDHKLIKNWKRIK